MHVTYVIYVTNEWVWSSSPGLQIQLQLRLGLRLELGLWLRLCNVVWQSL